MTDERKLPAPPIRGMILIDDKWEIRRYGLLVQRELTCIYGHRIKTEARPFEIALPCNAREGVGAPACRAHLYIFSTRAKLLWAMDVTHAESTIIDQYSMDVAEIVAHFGVSFPVDMKISRLNSTVCPPTQNAGASSPITS